MMRMLARTTVVAIVFYIVWASYVRGDIGEAVLFAIGGGVVLGDLINDTRTFMEQRLRDRGEL